MNSLSCMYVLWPPFSGKNIIFLTVVIVYIGVCNYVIDINTFTYLLVLWLLLYEATWFSNIVKHKEEECLFVFFFLLTFELTPEWETNANVDWLVLTFWSIASSLCPETTTIIKQKKTLFVCNTCRVRNLSYLGSEFDKETRKELRE